MFVKCSRALAQVGVASLRFDFYGSGESDGEFRQMTLRGEIADGRALLLSYAGKKVSIRSALACWDFPWAVQWLQPWHRDSRQKHWCYGAPSRTRLG